MSIKERKRLLNDELTRLAEKVRNDMKNDYVHVITLNKQEVAEAMSLVGKRVLNPKYNTKGRWAKVVQRLHSVIANPRSGGEIDVASIISRSYDKPTGEVFPIKGLYRLSYDKNYNLELIILGKASGYTYNFDTVLANYRAKLWDYFLAKYPGAGRVEYSNLKEQDYLQAQMAHKGTTIGYRTWERFIQEENIEEDVAIAQAFKVSGLSESLPDYIARRIKFIWTDEPVFDSEGVYLGSQRVVRGELVKASKNTPIAERSDIRNIKSYVDLYFDTLYNRVKSSGKWGDRRLTILSGSPTPTDDVENYTDFKLVDSFVKAGVTIKGNKKAPKKRSPSTATSDSYKKGGKVTKSTQKAKFRSLTSGKKTSSSSTSPMALANIINQYLPQTLKSMMVAPKLVYRTGRFANSAKVTNIMQGSRGGMSAEYTYMKNPYQTFEPGFRMGSTYRDPRPLISGAIRQIAMEQMGIKFGNIRRI